ncbi:MAG: glycosyltransferase, partial [Gemmatimonadota bacterium]
MSETVLVVPVYNEARRLVADPWLQYLNADRSRALLFVDDGSTDNTVSLLQQLRDHAPAQVSILQLPKNAGKAEAVRCGMVQALAETERYAGFIDADLSAPLSEVGLLHDNLERYPEAWSAFGSRVKLLGRDIVRSERRHYLGRLFATFASIALDLPVYDTQ